MEVANVCFVGISGHRPCVAHQPLADVIGVRALAVHAKDDRAIAFYRHFGFTASPTDAQHLFMIIKDIRLAAGQKP